MTHVAYALRAEHADTFGGAVLCVGPNGEALDTAQALKKGKGMIVVSENDTYTLSALDQHLQFKRVAVPEKAPDPVDRFEEMTVAALRDEAQSLGVEHPGRSREELLASVRAAVTPDDEQEA
jgi:hypothetical protein